MRHQLLRLAILAALSTAAAAQQGPPQFSREWYAQFSGPYSQPVAPFRIVGNIYYVGAVNLASYLVTTPEGHILIDTGMAEMHDGIVSSVEQLGFKAADIRIMLSNHAHFDHVDGHALMQRRTGAQVMAMAGDAGTMERMRKGERPHPLLNGREAWTNQLAASEQVFEPRVAQEESRR